MGKEEDREFFTGSDKLSVECLHCGGGDIMPYGILTFGEACTMQQ